MREIIGMIDVTPLPRTPAYVKGVINLRGKIIPIIELREKFGLPAVPITQETCIIVVEIASTERAGAYQLGVAVDAVREVLSICRDDIEPPPTFHGGIPLSLVMGMGTGKVKDRVVILLDINGVGMIGEIETLEQASGSTGPDAATA